MKRILFMLTKSPYGNTEAKQLLQRAKSGDMIVIAQDAVFGMTNPNGDFSRLINEKRAEGIKVTASAPDCLARGITPPTEIPMISYAEQVDLICEYELFC